MRALNIKKGDRYGMLTVIGEVEKIGQYRAFQLHCDCGNLYAVKLNHLRRSTWPVRSCGCQQRKQQETFGDQVRTHGQCKTRIYKRWCGMKRRCENPNARGYSDYGGRGIEVCERWQTFANFLADMGELPSDKHQLDRIDNDGNYEPGNVRWATREIQLRNRRKMSGTKSRYRGVDFWKSKWRARLTLDSKVIYLGTYDSEEEAAQAYDQLARPLGFHLNFPSGGKR